jgi:hypothetical protein
MSDQTTSITQNPRPKVFRMNQADWWAGYDLESTMLAFANQLGFDSIAEAQAARVFEDPSELSDPDMDGPLFEGITFRDALAELETLNAPFPCFLGSPLAGPYTRYDLMKLAA